MPRPRLYQIAAPAAGLDQETPATLMPDQASPNLRNVRVRGGVLFKRLGSTTITSASANASVASGPMLLDDFGRLSGSTTAMVAACSALYKWTGSGWSAIKTGLSGALDGYHSAVVMNDCWIYTNGVDHVQKWTGTGDASDLSGGADYQTPAYHVCRAVATFSDRLLLLGTNEDGTSLPYRVRWSELGKIDEFNEAEGGGYTDLTGDPGGLQGAELLGNWLAVYGANSIWLGTYVGGNVVFAFNRIIPNAGTRAPRTVKDLGNAHIFMGRDDIYHFDGTTLTPIGRRIRDELFSGMNPDDHVKCFAALNRDDHLYRLYVPYSADYASRCYIYDYQQNTWTMDTVDTVTAAAALELGSGLTIDELPGTIDELQGTIDELGQYSGQQFHAFAHSGGMVYKEDGLTVDDYGTAVDGRWDSKDFTFGNEYVVLYKRIIEILFEARGQQVEVWHSTDHGGTWTRAETQTLTSAYARYRVPVDEYARQIRVRFRNNTSGSRFWLRWLGFKYHLESER